MSDTCQCSGTRDVTALLADDGPAAVQAELDRLHDTLHVTLQALAAESKRARAAEKELRRFTGEPEPPPVDVEAMLRGKGCDDDV